MAIKAIILIGGPNKGQRFRPLSFESPKYMFPVGGQTIIGHLIESCLKLECLSEIILLGFYQQNEMIPQNQLQKLVQKCLEKRQATDKNKMGPVIRYLQEFTRMGTAGGLYHFRDQIRHGNPDGFLLINGDICGDFDFNQMLNQHRETIRQCKLTNQPEPLITVMTTEATAEESLNYGCIVKNLESHLIEHYVEKPSTFVSNVINCGAYFCSLELLTLMGEAMQRKRHELLSSDNYNAANGMIHAGVSENHIYHDYLSLEVDILQQISSQPRCYAYQTNGSWWCQVKTAASAIYANRRYLEQSKNSQKICQTSDGDDRGKTTDCTIIGNVYIHPSANVDKTSVIGPNVSIMENCIIGPGVRIRDSIILQNAVINANSMILCSIVGWDCSIGRWVRIEGTPNDPDPNQKLAKVQNPSLFNDEGKLNPSISVLGSSVKISSGIIILNTIILPHKELTRSYRNEIVL